MRIAKRRIIAIDALKYMANCIRKSKKAALRDEKCLRAKIRMAL